MRLFEHENNALECHLEWVPASWLFTYIDRDTSAVSVEQWKIKHEDKNVLINKWFRFIWYIDKNKWSEVWLADFSTLNYSISTCELLTALVTGTRAELRWPTDMVGRPICWLLLWSVMTEQVTDQYGYKHCTHNSLINSHPCPDLNYLLPPLPIFSYLISTNKTVTSVQFGPHNIPF